MNPATKQLLRKSRMASFPFLSVLLATLAIGISPASAALITGGPAEDFRAPVTHLEGEWEITETEGEINLFFFKFKWKDQGKIRLNTPPVEGLVSEDVVGVGFVTYDGSATVSDLLSPTGGEILTLTTVFGLDVLPGPLTAIGGLDIADTEFDLLEPETFAGISTTVYAASTSFMMKTDILSLPELVLCSASQLSLFDSASSVDGYWVSQVTVPSFDFTVPEPSCFSLGVLGVLGVANYSRRRRTR